MEFRKLGKTGIEVSRLCYGTLTMSKSQSDKTPREGGGLIAYALKRGVNFLDTAELYGTYSHIKQGIKQAGALPVISTKSYAYDRKSASESFELARRDMGIDIIDIFMLHEQENVLTMIGHMEALKFYLEMKEKGKIKAVGISTHAVEPLAAILKAKGRNPFFENRFPRINEFDLRVFSQIDVVHPIINLKGIGILDGTKEEMENALQNLNKTGTGIFGMKILGGGNLLNNFEDSFQYALSLDYVDSFAVGMQSIREIDANINIFSKGEINPEDSAYARSKERHLHIEQWCTGCAGCVERCKSKALVIIDKRAVVDKDKCVLCSYCASACKEFAIKVV